MSTIERKRGGGPTGNRSQSALKRAQIIEMRIAGHTQDEVAEKVGLARSGVQYHEQAWLAEREPTSEITEARRQTQLASIDQVRAQLFSWLADESERPLQLAVVDRLDKLWAREARLLGLDLQQGISVTLVTREALAASLGWDDAIEVEATEVQDADA